MRRLREYEPNAEGDPEDVPPVDLPLLEGDDPGNH